MKTVIRSAVRYAQEDYINPADGLLYCGKCHTPKEEYFEEQYRFNGYDRHPVMCRCQQEEHDRRTAEKQQNEKLAEISRLREKAFRDIPAQTWRFENVPPTPQLEKLSRYVSKWDKMKSDNIGLILFGDVGTGKTYAAGCIANAVIEKLDSVIFAGISDIVNRLQGKFGDERDNYIRSLMKADLLILDDLGSERSTSFGREQTFDIINKRVLSGKPMIITTNIPLNYMKSAPGIDERRIFDRILEKCIPVLFDGENFRKKNTPKAF